MSDLLDAVDALTKPVRQKRIKDTDHDHDWLAVVEPLTRDELKQLRAQRRKLGIKERLNPEEKVNPTGEWWCPWCPDGENVTLMPEHSWSATETLTQEDPPLLDRLESEFAPDQGQGGAKLAGREQIPLAADAYDKALEIRKELDIWYRRLGAKPGTTIPLRQLITSWHVLHLGSTDPDEEFVRQLRTWRTDIRNLLDPKPPRPEITGICPRCEFAFVITKEKTIRRALQGVEGDTYDETSVTCQVCGSIWIGRNELGELANATRRLDGREERASGPLVA